MATINSLTAREMLTAVINGNVTPSVIHKAQEMLNALDARNAKRKSADSKGKREVAERVRAVREFFTTSPVTAWTRDDVAAACGITPAQATAACAVLVTEGHIVKATVKVGKAKRIAYSRPAEFELPAAVEDDGEDDDAQFLPSEVTI